MKSCIKVDSVSDNSSYGYTPQMIKKAYGIRTMGNGINVKVAMIDFIGNRNIQHNLDIFSDEYGLSRTEVHYHDISTVNTPFVFSAYIEPCVDTQWVHAISEKAELHVYRAASFDVSGAVKAIKLAINDKSDIVLLTFQAPFLTEYLSYIDMFSGDTVFVVSSGDYGSGAYFPSCFSTCIAVGGTSLNISPSGNRLDEEKVWSGTGGGVCQYVEIPYFQKKFKYINDLTNGKRGVPDISFLADPNYGYSVYHSSQNGLAGWYKIGGTSVAASVIAGIISNFISSNRTISKSDILPMLYEIAGGTEYININNNFIDIIIGSNGEFNAQKGYDLCTGLGSFTGF